MALLNLVDLPSDPIERLNWLAAARESIVNEFDTAFAEAYFSARLQHRFDSALALHIHGKKKALALSRAHNNSKKRMVRWNDGLDRTSSAYSG